MDAHGFRRYGSRFRAATGSDARVIHARGGLGLAHSRYRRRRGRRRDRRIVRGRIAGCRGRLGRCGLSWCGGGRLVDLNARVVIRSGLHGRSRSGRRCGNGRRVLIGGWRGVRRRRRSSRSCRRLGRRAGGWRCGLRRRLGRRRGGRLSRRRRRRRGRFGGRGSGLRRLGGSGGDRACRQEAQRVDIALRLRGDADAHVDVRDVDVRRAARPDRPDDGAFRDGVAAMNGDGAEVEKRDGVVVGRPDRDRQASAGDRAHERDRAARRSANRGARGAAHVDTAMLAARVRIRTEAEGANHRAVGRPGPRARAWDDEQHEEKSERKSPHRTTTLLSILRTRRPR
jgi:hypothetical protein